MNALTHGIASNDELLQSMPATVIDLANQIELVEMALSTLFEESQTNERRGEMYVHCISSRHRGALEYSVEHLGSMLTDLKKQVLEAVHRT